MDAPHRYIHDVPVNIGGVDDPCDVDSLLT